MHGSLGSMAIWLRGRSLRTRVVIVNYKSQTNTNIGYILQSAWSFLLLVNIQSSLYCKQCSLQETSFYNFLWYMNRIYNFLLVYEKKIPPVTIEKQGWSYIEQKIC